RPTVMLLTLLRYCCPPSHGLFSSVHLLFFFFIRRQPHKSTLFPYTTLFRSILSKTDALDEEKWLNMLGTFVKDWFRYESHFVHGRDSLVDILKERGLLSESDAVQPLIGKKS